MVLNLCGKYGFDARIQEIVRFDRGSSESTMVARLILSFSYISSNHTQDIRIQDIVILKKIILLLAYIYIKQKFIFKLDL